MKKLRRWYRKLDDDMQYSFECFAVAVFVVVVVLLIITFFDKAI